MYTRNALLVVLCTGLLLVTACASRASAAASADPTEVPTFVQPTTQPTLSPTSLPTATPEVSKYNQGVPDKLRAIMVSYGSVDEGKLSVSYWQKVDKQIDTYGPAKRIATLEYHGNRYSFYDGSYSMTPEEFEREMTYLCQNDYHFVTSAEVAGYIQGWLNLPARSIILTADTGNHAYKFVPDLITLYGNLAREYGCSPHIIAFIQTYQMDPDQNPLCVGDACWQVFRDAVASGYFSIGSHSEQHLNVNKMTEADFVADYTLSKSKIQKGTGLNVYSLAWPLEVCTYLKADMAKMGFTYAFGGVDRGVGRAFTYVNDPDPLCLPRLLPPNPNGISGRPNGMTLAQILDFAINKYLPPN